MWLNLEDIKEKAKNVLLDPLDSPSEFFGTSVETVVGKIREAKAQSVAFRKYILGQSKSLPKTQGRRESVVTCAPPRSREKSRS